MKNVYEFNLEQDGHKLYYQSEPREIGILERNWLNNLKGEIANESTHEHNVVINLTWFKANWEETEPLRKFVESLGPVENVKLWFAGTIDGNYWITYSHIEIYHYLKNQGYAISFVGFADEHWHSWMPKWFVSNNLNVDMNDIVLSKSPEYLYLCYNRKPKIHREWLVNELLSKGLIDRGWVTFEKGHYPEIDKLTGNTDNIKPTTDERFSRPEDLTSLGYLNVWRNSFLVVVSETDHDDPWQLTEKTWKPIFGLRPFLINGHRDVYDILEKLGFYTPKDLFKDNKLDCHHENVVRQIQKLYHMSPNELYDLWEDQFEMLLYNRQRMFEMAINDSKVLNWPQASPKPHSVPVAS